MQKSNFVSPAYGVQRVDIDDLVSQKANPNSMHGKAWEALQQSVFNTGYTFPVIASNNAEYDPSTAGMQKPNLLELSDGEATFTEGGKVGTQVSDDEIAKYFQYRLIDGSHRTQLVRQGKHWFHHGHDHSDEWAVGQHLPQKPGPEMLAYIAWREGFSIPCVVLDIDPTAQMSAEILHNTARGAHSLDSMKDIVYNLINIAGMSEEWVAQNLYLDLESIKRMQQLSGLKASFAGGENGSIDDADMAWSPEKDDSYGRKLQSYLTREATKFVEIYRHEHRDEPELLAMIPTSGTALDQALAVGFDQEAAMLRHGQEHQHLVVGKNQQ